MTLNMRSFACSLLMTSALFAAGSGIAEARSMRANSGYIPRDELNWNPTCVRQAGEYIHFDSSGCNFTTAYYVIPLVIDSDGSKNMQIVAEDTITGSPHTQCRSAAFSSTGSRTSTSAFVTITSKTTYVLGSVTVPLGGNASVECTLSSGARLYAVNHTA